MWNILTDLLLGVGLIAQWIYIQSLTNKMKQLRDITSECIGSIEDYINKVGTALEETITVVNENADAFDQHIKEIENED